METETTEEIELAEEHDDIEAEEIPRYDLAWQAPEYILKKKGADWFLALGVITLASTLSALIYGNALLAILIIISAGALVLFAVRQPLVREFALTPTGVRVDDKYYPYTTLESFWVIHYQEKNPKVIIQSKKITLNDLTIPIEEATPEEVRDYLLHHLTEKEANEPFSQHVMEYLGF